MGCWRGGEWTFEFVFAYVDGGWRVNYVGGEKVDHFRCWGSVCNEIERFVRCLGKEPWMVAEWVGR